jgi:hypothetical protein
MSTLLILPIYIVRMMLKCVYLHLYVIVLIFFLNKENEILIILIFIPKVNWEI